MNSPNDTDSKLQPGIKAPLPASGDDSNNLPQGNAKSLGDDDNHWFDSIRTATTHNLESAADASSDFARNNPWKMMGICIAAGMALGVLVSLR
ncbi:glycine zipper domain-containing protein [Bordetella muralis]|jgi:ElaB/YqjD/DUF883 family membrane-anchored ribosome-binding protein|uniref:glycine zipper domain-containing protein n=1 Tax=Bordetella muralis TaxID=1649130 RepID=UPI0039EEA12E